MHLQAWRAAFQVPGSFPSLSSGMPFAPAWGMRRHGSHSDRTLQDDRNKLQIDPEDDSELVSGEGAPLADDGVQEQPHANRTPPLGYVGGAPVPLDTHATHGTTARKDQPIDD